MEGAEAAGALPEAAEASRETEESQRAEAADFWAKVGAEAAGECLLMRTRAECLDSKL